MVDPMDGTGAAMLAFLDESAVRRLLTKENVKTIKVGAKEVLKQAEGEGWESTDVRTLDVNDVVRRFEISATKYSPKTLAAYGQRFRNAMNMYRGFLADPGGWRPSRPRKSLMPRRETNDDRPQVKVTLPATAPNPPTDEGPHERPDMMTFPHPIRRGNQTLYARLILPHDLTMKEAERIGQHIKTLAIEDPPDSPADALATTPDLDPDPDPDSKPEHSTPESHA